MYSNRGTIKGYFGTLAIVLILLSMVESVSASSIELLETASKLEMQCKDGATQSCVEFCKLSWSNDWDDSDTCNSIPNNPYSEVK